MNNSDFIDSIADSFTNIAERTINYLPNILVALALLLVGFAVARLASKWLGLLVDKIENSKPVTSTLKRMEMKQIDIDGVVSVFVRWTVLIIFFGAAVDVLGLDVLTNTFNALLSYAPNILAAAVVAALSFVAANAVYEIVNKSAKESKITSHTFLAKSAQIAVLVFGLPLAVAQLGLDLTILTNNITVIVAGVMLAVGLAFGLGGRETAGKIVDGWYKNWKKK